MAFLELWVINMPLAAPPIFAWPATTIPPLGRLSVACERVGMKDISNDPTTTTMHRCGTGRTRALVDINEEINLVHVCPNTTCTLVPSATPDILIQTIRSVLWYGTDIGRLRVL